MQRTMNGPTEPLLQETHLGQPGFTGRLGRTYGRFPLPMTDNDRCWYAHRRDGDSGCRSNLLKVDPVILSQLIVGRGSTRDVR